MKAETKLISKADLALWKNLAIHDGFDPDSLCYGSRRCNGGMDHSEPALRGIRKDCLCPIPSLVPDYLHLAFDLAVLIFYANLPAEWMGKAYRMEDNSLEIKKLARLVNRELTKRSKTNKVRAS